MLIVLAAVAVLTRLGMPAIDGMLHSMQLNSASSDFVGSLHLTRSEALRRNGRVSMCKSVDGEFCTGDGGWQQGWIIFEDANGNGAREAAETVVTRREALPQRLRLLGNPQVASYISYDSRGVSRLANGGFQAGTLTLCRDDIASDARQVIVNAVGRPRVQRASLESCS